MSRLSLWKLGSPGASSSPGARPAVHAGKCSPGGVHLHIKIKKPQKGGSILFKLRSGFSLPQLAGAGPESAEVVPKLLRSEPRSVSQPAACLEAPRPSVFCNSSASHGAQAMGGSCPRGVAVLEGVVVNLLCLLQLD